MQDFVSKIIYKDKNILKYIKNLNIDETVEKFKLDKKHRKNSFTLILFDKKGSLKRFSIENNKKNCELIKSTFKSLKKI